MYGHRAKRFPKLPSHRRDLQIPFPFRTTKAGDDFLLWQSASRHILVFATGYNIRLLAAMQTWVMDGTFKIVPQWYQQLFTIHAIVAGKLVPAVYCLCTGKDIATYGFIFQALIDKAAVLEVDLNPDTIICDFETALIPAIRGYFPNMRVQGCYFYFYQAVHRKVGELGLKTRYRQHEETRRKIRMLLATAFLPVPQVDTVVSLLEAGTTEPITTWMEGWHNQLNRKAAKGHNGFHELLELLIAFPPFKRVKSAMYGHRAKRFPKLPSHRRDLQIPFPFRTTKAGDDFLLWQSASRHILVFATGYNIRLLAAMQTWVMDGTFKIVPQWYQQLFTIHAIVAGKLVPAVYCLCTGKDIATYGFIFQALIDKAAVLEVDLNPDTIICDFETALISAIRGYFPNMRVQGCYFYFYQAVHRKVGELGLKTRYRQHEETRRKIRMLLATAFLPVPHVNTGVSLLEAGHTAPPQPSLSYTKIN
ncbi:hypothetical protein T12_12274 [Trichinella patagoniensis]|uniref:MULE transposase domain-containing protein n=1 Tax=Trichinella patagoniensis TaxID=990121 RepID=A0A0V0ZA56_9BILA|nr:hypothetical protein T12_12274 [Trichinella patagoniensis]